MRRTLIVAAVLGLLLPRVAWAQSKKDEVAPVGSYAPSIEAEEWLNVEKEEDIPSLVELRGTVVVLFFWVSWHQGGEMFLPYVNMMHHRWKKGVYTIGATDASRKTTQRIIDENKIFFPVAAGSQAAKEYGYRNGFGFVVIDPLGKIAFKGSGQGDLTGMVNAVVKLYEDLPPFKTSPLEAKVCYQRLDEAYDHIRQEKYTKAFKAAQDVFQRSVLGDRLSSKAMEIADLIDLLGYDELAAFEPAYEQKHYDKAAEILREVVRRFRKLDCYRDAKKLYEKLQEKEVGFKRAVERFGNEDAAARLYLEARDDLKARRFGESYDKLDKIVTVYPETEAAEYAEAMIARMEANKDFWLLVLDHRARAECQEMLARARNLIRRGRYEEAEPLLRQIMKDYAKTIWAEEAVEELKRLPRRP